MYLYGVPDYDYWASEIGHALEPGTFGENLTVENLESGNICIGAQALTIDMNSTMHLSTACTTAF